MKCPECGSVNSTKAGLVWQARRKVHRYRCKDCGRLFTPKGENKKKEG